VLLACTRAMADGLNRKQGAPVALAKVCLAATELAPGPSILAHANPVACHLAALSETPNGEHCKPANDMGRTQASRGRQAVRPSPGTRPRHARNSSKVRTPSSSTAR
jgi:hypothetical protein